MLGALIAFLIVVWEAVVKDGTWLASYFAVVDFLWIWYWVWGAATGVFILVLLWMIHDGHSFSYDFSRFLASRWIGSLVGVSIHGVMGFLSILRAALRLALLLTGVYLLRLAGDPSMTSFSEFNVKRLIFGGVFFLAGLALSRLYSKS